MLAEQHDLIVFGAGLAGQTAAALAARQGYRVLLLETPAPADPRPLACCAALDNLLASLDAKQPPRQPNERFQFITDEIRLDLCGTLPLAQELEREFPGQHSEILALLNRLDDWGRSLSELLSDAAPDSPWHPLRTLLLHRRQWRQGLPARRLRKTVDQLTRPFANQGWQRAMLQLLSGLCLTKPARLPIAKAALSWHTATRPQCISLRVLTQLISDRFTAAGGHRLTLQAPAVLQWQGKRLQGIRLQGGELLQADQFLTGPWAQPIVLPSSVFPAPASEISEPQRWIVSGVKSQRPPMLAPRFILGGDPSLHLEWETREYPTNSIEMAAPAETPIADQKPLRRRLATLLPFTQFKLSPVLDPVAAEDLNDRLWPSIALPQPVAKNLLHCHGAGLLPLAENNAAVILGQAAAGLLHKRLSQRT